MSDLRAFVIFEGVGQMRSRHNFSERRRLSRQEVEDAEAEIQSDIVEAKWLLDQEADRKRREGDTP